MKKGIEPVVATVLLILITIAAIGIIWATVIPLLTKGGPGIECMKAQLTLDREYLCYNPTTDQLKVKVDRGAEEFDLKEVKIRYTTISDTGTVSTSIETRTDAPANPYDGKSYTIGTTYNVTKVEVAAVIKVGAKEQKCDFTDSETDIPECA